MLEMLKHLVKKLEIKAWIILILIVGGAFFLNQQQNRAHAYERELKTMKETLNQKELALGVYQAKQDVVDNLQDLVLDRFSDVIANDKTLQKELKSAVLRSISTIKIQPEPEGPINVTPSGETPEGVRSYFASDRFSRFHFTSAGEVTDIEYPPINLSIVDLEEQGIRKQLAVVTGGWDNGPIKSVEISRSILEERPWKPYYSAEIFAGNRYASAVLKRHSNRWLAFGGGVAYDYDARELSFGLAASLNLFVRAR